MPFLGFVFWTSGITNNVKKTCRREDGFDYSHRWYFLITEKASASASAEGGGLRASVTVEAVFCVPLFFYAAICLIWMLEMRAVQSAVRCGLQKAGKEAAAEFYELPFLLPSGLESDVVSAIGVDRLERSLVEGGSGGLHCEKSYALPGSGIMELKVYYRIRLPVPAFAIPPIRYSESMRIKGWNGYEKQYIAENTDRTIVYITENGIVYHKDYHCTYLEPSIRMVAAGEIEGLRNEGGEIYHRCERCGWRGTEGGAVYITDYGNRYHTTTGCGGVKRRIYAVPIGDAKGKGACSKCGK